MYRFLAIPHEPLARFRLLSVWFAATVAFLNVALFAFYSGLTQTLRIEGAVASALLGAWWLYGYRRGGFPAIGWIVDVVLISLVAAGSPMPLRAIGVFYAGIQFRALYVNRRQVALLAGSYGVARIASLLLEPGEPGIRAVSTASIFQILALTVIAVTLQLFVEATERHGAIERALKQSDERFRLVASAMRDVVYDWDVVTGTIEWTESMQHVFGFTPDMVGTELLWWLARVHHADRDMLQRSIADVLANPAVAMETIQYRVRRADESYAHVSWSMLVQRSPTGAAERVLGSIRDITPERHLEDQLRQSQKLEAVGQLAGGVAHDFNNLLTVIGGHVYMLDRTMPRNVLTDKHLGGITLACDRAASLTKQLLAFSRKQLLTPTVLNVNAVVDDVLLMMRPVIGEHIQIVTRLDPLLRPIFADSGQLSQVLVNLALNARDAMPNGGTLTIETANDAPDTTTDDYAAAPLPAGGYVRLTVRDTGMGMNAETLARAFEPFFTTKPQGQGSGLGLATVYGIVKQSFGDIRADSTPGAGSTFTILLPEARERPSRETRDTRPPALVGELRPLRERSLLLVEDDDSVREFAQSVLEWAGYRVRSAANGVQALEMVAGKEASIDLVVTDVVMPQMGGRQMVDQLRRARPELPVLYITGYTDDATMLGELTAMDARLLEKPFTAAALERAVEDVITSVEGTTAPVARR